MIITYPPTSQGSGVAWPTTVGLPKSGLFLKTVFDVIADAFQWGFDRLVFTDGAGDLVERKNLSGYAIPTGLSPSTRYYVYLVTYEGAGCSVVVSTESERLGDTFTGLTGAYTHYREIGEFYVNASGDVVEFSRNGDTVTFEDYLTYVVYSAQAMTNAFVEFAFPAGLPARIERAKFASQSSASGRAMQVWANNSDGSGETFTSTYSNNTSSSYDSSIQSVSFWLDLSSPQQDSIFAQHHFSGVASSPATHYLYLSGYKWSV